MIMRQEKKDGYVTEELQSEIFELWNDRFAQAIQTCVYWKALGPGQCIRVLTANKSMTINSL